MVYSACKFNKQGRWQCTTLLYSSPNFELVPCSVSGSNCCFWIQMQVSQATDKVVWYTYLFKNFLQFVMIHTVKGFSVVNEAEADVFLEFSCFFYDPTDVDNLSLVPLPFLNTVWTSGSSQFTLKPHLEIFEHYFASMGDECNCAVVWRFFGIAFLWDWNENTFSSPVATAEFSKFAGILSAALSQHHLLGFEIAQLKVHHLH